MYSQCPECLTRFRVTAAALRAAHGTVRCGRCGSAFDALQRLTDTVPDDAEPSALPAMLGSSIAAFDAPGHARTGDRTDSGVGGGDAEVGTDFHFSADDIEQVFIDARDWQKRFPRTTERAAQEAPGASGPSANDDDGAAGATTASTVPEDIDVSSIPIGGAPVVFVHEPEAIEDITLEGERIVIEGLPEFDDELREIVDDTTGEPVDEEVARDDAAVLPGDRSPPDPDATDQFEALHVVPERETSADAVEPAAPVPTLPPIVPFRLRQPPAVLEETHDGDGAGESVTEASRSTALGWGLGALVLAMALVAQLTHHYRQDLARDANLGPAVRGAYARLGRPLTPDWDLAAFEVRQWGASEPAPSVDGAMSVRASLRNGAGFAQPLPLLRLEFEDRFGGTVARRDFEPAEYLNDPGQASRLLAPGAKTEAELDVVAVGSDAIGYRLDVCMREESGAVRCAQSPADSPAPR